MLSPLWYAGLWIYDPEQTLPLIPHCVLGHSNKSTLHKPALWRPSPIALQQVNPTLPVAPPVTQESPCVLCFCSSYSKSICYAFRNGHCPTLLCLPPTGAEPVVPLIWMAVMSSSLLSPWHPDSPNTRPVSLKVKMKVFTVAFWSWMM